MEPITLTAALVALLRPYLRGLLKDGEAALEEAGEETTEQAKGIIGRVWRRLRPKLNTKAPALYAARNLAEPPDDEEVAETLKRQIAEILEADPALARELSADVEEARRAGIIVADTLVQLVVFALSLVVGAPPPTIAATGQSLGGSVPWRARGRVA